MNLNRTTTTACFLALLAVISLLGSGCHSTPKPKPWNIKITKTTPATVDVDVIGVSSSEKQDWASYDLNKYWSPNDERRREAVASDDLVSFSLKMGEASELKIDDKHWKKWLRNPTAELLIIANLPGSFSGGADDFRRKFLYLGKSDWDPDIKKTIEIEIQTTLIKVKTTQIPRD